MSQYQGYFGQFTVGASSLQANIVNATTVGGANFGLNSGADVFICGYDNESTEHLCEWVGNTLKVQTNHANAVCNYSPTTGRVSIYFSEAVNVHWTDRELGDTLGFTDEWSNGTQVHTGDKQPRYTWRPTRGAAEFPTHVNAWWGPKSTSKVTRSVDGTVRSVRGNLLYSGAYSYRNLPRADVIIDPMNTADNYRSMEQFWSDTAHYGAVVRVYPDRNAVNATSYTDGVIIADETSEGPMDVGGFDEVAIRSQPPWDVLWDVDFKMVKNV